jgi:hypothetical protein
MPDQNISAEFVNGTCNQLSAELDDSTNRFHYSTVKLNINDCVNFINYWTSRYMQISGFKSTDPAFHDIKLIDLFNNKSM